MFMEFAFCTGIRLVNEKLVLCQYFTRLGVRYDPKRRKSNKCIIIYRERVLTLILD